MSKEGVEKLENLQSEVKAFADKIIEISKSDEKVKDLYKGVQIYFSRIQEKPKFMFLGINPGSGYFDYNHECVYRFEPLEEIEYKTYDYKLAVEWKYVFGNKENMLNRMDLLENAFKTNLYYIATKDKKDLDKLRRHLSNNYGLREECFRKPYEWTKTFIDVIKPEIILCEGFSVLDELKKIYPEMNCVKADWGFNAYYKIAYLDNSEQKITFIACGRVRSGIKGHVDLAATIKSEAGL